VSRTPHTSDIGGVNIGTAVIRSNPDPGARLPAPTAPLLGTEVYVSPRAEQNVSIRELEHKRCLLPSFQHRRSCGKFLITVSTFQWPLDFGNFNPCKCRRPWLVLGISLHGVLQQMPDLLASFGRNDGLRSDTVHDLDQLAALRSGAHRLMPCREAIFR